MCSEKENTVIGVHCMFSLSNIISGGHLFMFFMVLVQSPT